MARTVHALAVIHFPYPVRCLDRMMRLDLAEALMEVGRSIAAGTMFGETVIIPFQEGAQMELKAKLSGPQGDMWGFSMYYKNLPPEYVLEIAGAARAYYNLLKNTAGGSGGNDRQYTFEFEYDAKESAPKSLPPDYSELFKGKVKNDDLLYSQAADVQNAGIRLLQRLMEGAEMEIKSGQRK